GRDENDPYRIGFPFRSLYFQNANSSNALIRVKLNGHDSRQDLVDLEIGDVFDLGEQIAEAYLSWDPQPGVSGHLLVFTNSSFRPGKMRSVNAGGVSINDGSVAQLLAPVAGTISTAAELLPLDLNRKVGTLVNDTGGDIYLGGDNTVTDAGATKGIIWPAGERMNWKNTAALWGYFTASGNVIRMRQE
ncbi:MAG TPA: hypothetical protein PL182_06405, partial [Pseudobdellovibrionaceae bacterium]|nr:hypothetical protein [Pseudobdellovibrionaceae bacterium]